MTGLTQDNLLGGFSSVSENSLFVQRSQLLEDLHIRIRDPTCLWYPKRDILILIFSLQSRLQKY
uniref:Uncharacterized protein n=1 Tax=Meloidogyne incognita TaxID=6306 RepID=A0A914KTF1_MELIC